MSEDGQTGWETIHGLIRALQIELGITETANNFGAGTQARFTARWPQGIKEQDPGDASTSNVYAIIQCALWCKGYSTGSNITTHFYGGTGSAIKDLKTDIGIGGDSTVTVGIMKALLSMDQFELLIRRGGQVPIRKIQQQLNREYGKYVGIVPTDGLYGREMNKALIQVLQAIEGFTPVEATGNFGAGTRSRLKVITASNARSHPTWVWFASVMLTCNGYPASVSSQWSRVTKHLEKFQREYALPVSGKVDRTTWMSLLTSKGDPDRPCVACDTRFEITDEFLTKLKSDGYKIVGRYLTEPGQAQKKPEDYFKAIRPGELERIVKGGMKFFPIFQENSRQLSDFTPENGARHAREARLAAQRLNIPPTYIYFAVDMDVLGNQIVPYIAPYFRAILNNLGGGYKVGIYASRNVCANIIDMELAGSAFVSDMSYGFSGNLGFPIPAGWNYDQFTEISGYGGKWDLDRVAYAEKTPAVAYINATGVGSGQIDKSTDYKRLSPIDLIWHLEKRFEELRSQGKVGKDFITDPSGHTSKIEVVTWSAVLNYLAKDYLRDSSAITTGMWSIAASSFRAYDAGVLEADSVASKIISALDRYISGWRQSMTDKTGERIDLSHLCATLLGYTTLNLIPDAWTGWAGDLASAMGHIQKVVDWNPGADLQQVCVALVGQDENYRAHPGLQGLVLDKQFDDDWDSVGNTCNRDDLCCDGDAIVIAKDLKAGSDKDPHLLSDSMRKYYDDASKLANRFKQIAWSVGANDAAEATMEFRNVEKQGGGYLRKILADNNDLDSAVINSACETLAYYIF